MLSANATVLGTGTARSFALSRARGTGFTLVELLVVLAIIAVLAALLLPALSRTKQGTRIAQCLSNLHQVGYAIQMYIQDNDGRYPTMSGSDARGERLGGGDPDPVMVVRYGMESATNRILWQYTTSREVYRCPSDRGMDLSPVIQSFDSAYQRYGMSYRYNAAPWGEGSVTRSLERDPYNGIAGKKENWITSPSRYLLLVEAPAEPFWYGNTWRYFFWHYARGKPTVFQPYSRNATDRSIAAVLFADQHANQHDFTRAIKMSPNYPFEPQPLWYWYEPAR